LTHFQYYTARETAVIYYTLRTGFRIRTSPSSWYSW